MTSYLLDEDCLDDLCSKHTMTPDFSRSTTDVLAKRAAFICSNPECRAPTIGPNSEASKATIIGEAAHISGARPDSPRYDPQMSDMARAEITNGIWLCRNCHGKVDRDASRYPVGILFVWREQHERYAAECLGVSERLLLEQEEAHLSEFDSYPPVIRRIALDKPRGWEWRLTSELMRHLNRPVFRQLHDLRSGVYTRSIEHVDSSNPMKWVSARLTDMQRLFSPFDKLLQQLMKSWGPRGEPGDPSEIHHVCRLFRDALQQSVDHEERLRFVDIDDDYRPVIELLKDCIGTQIEKFGDIPAELDHVVSLIDSDHQGTVEEPLVIEKVLTLELPENWDQQMSREISRLERRSSTNPESGGIWNVLAFLFLFLIAAYVIF